MSCSVTSPKGLTGLSLAFLVGLVLVGGAASAHAAEYFIDPNGSPTGAGTIGDPWDIYKLDSATAAAPGDTIYLRGGTYYWPVRDDGQQGFKLNLQGDPNNKITVKPYDDERPIIDGGLTSYTRNPQHVLLYGLEVIVSEWYDPNNWVSTQSGSWPTDLDAPGGGINLPTGTGIDVVNCYVHHTIGGVNPWEPLGHESTIHGTIIHTLGWLGTDRYHGHSVYGQNSSGSMRMMDQNYFFETLSSNMHFWGSAVSTTSDALFQHNVFACHSDITTSQSVVNIFGGANRAGTVDLTIDKNIFYMSKAWFGYDTGAHDMTITDNVFIRGRMQFFGTYFGLVTSGNVEWYDPTFDGQRGVTPMNGLPTWTSGPIVDFHLNRYDSDRVNLCLIQPTDYGAEVQPYNNSIGSDTISVDFSSWLSNGDVVEVKDARDLYGPAVFTFTYAGSNVDVPVATTGPTGTCKEFSLYVCLRLLGNRTPSVDAGADQAVQWPQNVATLDAEVTDDGLPEGQPVTQTWSQESGPGTVTFADAGAVDTTATFSAAGTYLLRLTANDTARTASDTVTISLKANEAPIVDAGVNQTGPMFADLDGTVTDDGLPAGPLTVTWTADSGPGTVTFGDAGAVDTTATFSTAGVYVLRLTADDSELTAADTVIITANETAGLEMHLKLDEISGTDAADDTGNGHDGKLLYGTWTTGHLSGAAMFDEASDRIEVPDFALTADFSAAFWFQPTDNAGSQEQYLLCWGGYTLANNISVWLCEDSNAYAGLLRTSVRDSDDAQNILDIDDPNTVLDGDWHHYCVTVSAANGVRVYLDGSLAAFDPNNGGDSINPNSKLFLASRYAMGTTKYFGGAMDDVRIYGRELSTGEVAQLGGANAAPTVDAGPNQTIELPANTAALDGTVGDDGLPGPGSLTTTWTLAAGPASVQFGDSTAVDTTVTFSARGQYVLRLTASDGDLSTSDEVGVTVAAEGDLDGDGLITAADVDLLYDVLDTTVPPTDAMYDLTGDNQVTIADAEELVEVIVGTSMADTNLDMSVDILDLGNLANAYDGPGTFSDGDTNGDGVVDILDLGTLANDYGKSFP